MCLEDGLSAEEMGALGKRRETAGRRRQVVRGKWPYV